MLANLIGTVKRQIEHYDAQVARFTPDHPRYRPDRVAMYRRIAGELRDVHTHLVREQDGGDLSTRPTPVAATPEITKSISEDAPSRVPPADDLTDLPPELLAELSGGAKGESDPLIQIIEDRGGTATLDQILIDLYRKHREISKRALVSNKLYRLAKRGLCAAAPGRKGVYTTRDLPETKSDSDEAAETALVSTRPRRRPLLKDLLDEAMK